VLCASLSGDEKSAVAHGSLRNVCPSTRRRFGALSAISTFRHFGGGSCKLAPVFENNHPFACAAQCAHDAAVCQSEPRVSCTNERQVECQRSSINEALCAAHRNESAATVHSERNFPDTSRACSRCSSEGQTRWCKGHADSDGLVAVVALAARSAAGTRETLGTHDSGAPHGGAGGTGGSGSTGKAQTASSEAHERALD
jgi:hypothetical protein